MKCVVIVGGYSTGQFLSPFFKGHNYSCIHVQPGLELPAKFLTSFEKNKNDYIKNIIYDKDLSSVLTELKPYQIKFVIPGSEPGVNLADQISNALNLPTSNSLKLSEARRDKFLMHEALKVKGVAAMDHLASSDVKEIITWAKSRKGTPSLEEKAKSKFSIVLKPLSSAGTDGVQVCESEEEIKQAYNLIAGKKNIFGQVNEKVLAQRFLEGDEYVVNTVNYNGKSFVTEVWRSLKKNMEGAPVYDTQQPVSPDEKEFKVLADYNSKVLDALEIRYGAAHSEIMLTKDGPVLIEVAARLPGGIDPSADTEVFGYNPVSILVDSLLNPHSFLRMCEQPRLPWNGYLLMVYLISNASGKVVKECDYQPFKELAGLHSINFSFKPGDTISKTNDLVNSPGHICLISKTEKELKDGLTQIRKIEETFYTSLVDKSHSLPKGTSSQLISFGIQNQKTSSTVVSKTDVSADSLSP